MSHDDVEVFVFPLPKVVLFPATAQPLNIFEPRYIAMINDAMTLDRPIALTGSAAEGKNSGCGRLELLEERPDGTMLILLRSEAKVRLGSIDSLSKPYLISRATVIDEVTELDSGNVFYLRRLMNELAGWLERNIPQSKKRDEFMESMATDEQRVNTACSLLIADPDWQQKLLDIDDLNERLKLAASLLETGAATH